MSHRDRRPARLDQPARPVRPGRARRGRPARPPGAQGRKPQNGSNRTNTPAKSAIHARIHRHGARNRNLPSRLFGFFSNGARGGARGNGKEIGAIMGRYTHEGRLSALTLSLLLAWGGGAQAQQSEAVQTMESITVIG